MKNMIVNDLVGYKNLKIFQNPKYFMFSLDSVVLPNFVTIKKGITKILDLGTGNAPIPLILSTLTSANIYGIEIQKDIYDLAIKTIKINNKEKQIKIINDDMKNLYNYFEKNSFDIIVSNPPYFKVEKESKLNNVNQKTIARHEVMINLEELVCIASQYLKNLGVFAMVHRTDRLIEIIEVFKKYNLEPKKIRFLYSKQTKNSNMVLIEGRKNGGEGLKILPPLYVHNENGEYTEEIKVMFGII